MAIFYYNLFLLSTRNLKKNFKKLLTNEKQLVKVESEASKKAKTKVRAKNMYYLLVWEKETDKVIEDITFNTVDEAIIGYLKRINQPDDYDYQFAREYLRTDNYCIGNDFWNHDHTQLYGIEVGLI